MLLEGCYLKDVTGCYWRLATSTKDPWIWIQQKLRGSNMGVEWGATIAGHKDIEVSFFWRMYNVTQEARRRNLTSYE